MQQFIVIPSHRESPCFFKTRAIARTINKVTFNWDVKDEQDPVYGALAHSMLGVDATCAAGAWLVDLIPQRQPSFRCGVIALSDCFQVRYLPSWLPGTGFKATAEKWKAVHNHNIDFVYNAGKEDAFKVCV
jgi:hypothetical protein